MISTEKDLRASSQFESAAARTEPFARVDVSRSTRQLHAGRERQVSETSPTCEMSNREATRIVAFAATGEV